MTFHHAQSDQTNEPYDALIIGAGQSGVPLSTTLAQAGWRVALIEKQYVGGTCVNKGCTPTKTMIASARVAYLARRSADYGVDSGPVHVDLKTVRARKRAIVKEFRQGNLRRIEQAGVDLLRGVASFTGPHAVQVQLNDGGQRQLSASSIFINTGARPRLPKLPGLDQVNYLDSTSIMELAEAPEKLLVLGGGYVGVEFAQMFRRFGSQVSVVQRSSQLLTHEDDEIAAAVAEILRQDGVQVLLNAEAQKVRCTDAGQIELQLETSQGPQRLSGSHLLVAVGRVPQSAELNLAAAGIAVDQHGAIIANERLETNIEGVYALGDVKGGPAFTHISYDDFRILRANLLENGSRTTKDRMVPYTVFIDPQLGRVGITEKEARHKGYPVKIARMPMKHVARALEMDETRGQMKAVIDASNDQILGCAILGVEGGEVMAVIEVAMMGHLPYTALRDGVFAHPTLAESLNNLFMSIESPA